MRKTLRHFLPTTCRKIESSDFCRDFSVRLQLDFGMLHPATCSAINKTRIYGRPQNWEGLENDSIMHATMNWNCLYRRTTENLLHVNCDMSSSRQSGLAYIPLNRAQFFSVNKPVMESIIIQVPVDFNFGFLEKRLPVLANRKYFCCREVLFKFGAVRRWVLHSSRCHSKWNINSVNFALQRIDLHTFNNSSKAFVWALFPIC